jgi:adenylate kinase family enzyme
MGEILEIPVYHLDRLFWRPGWTPTPADEWKQIQAELFRGESWIIDGNYGGTMDLRLEVCDTVVFLDISRWVCIIRVVKRFLAFRNSRRPDMGDGCPEKIDIEFLRWIWDYPKRNRPEILKKLHALNNDKQVFVLRSAREVEDFCSGMRRKIKEEIPCSS